MARTWKANVNRAILDAAKPFNNLGRVAEEYLTNSLDAFETALHDNSDKEVKRKNCKVQFIIDRTNLIIYFKDEHPLLGMSSSKIFDEFFNIHGENESRKRYINVRGKHGTGKSAAFGIKAEYLLVDSVYQGKRTKVKSTLESLKGSKTAELEEIMVDVPTEKPNGTLITIQLSKKDFSMRGQRKRKRNVGEWVFHRDTTKAIVHIKNVFGAHLNKYNVELIEIAKGKEVYKDRINYQPREFVYEREYPVPPEIEEILGKTTLIIRRGIETNDDEAEKGICITSKGYTKEQTYFGLQNEPFSDLFFGEWEVPSIDEYEGENPPTLSTRELRLNQENELVQTIYKFGKEKLGEEIKNFAKDERKRKQDEKLKKLSRMADELAEILNEDFAEWEEITKIERGKKGHQDAENIENQDNLITNKADEESTAISHLGEGTQVELVEGEGELEGSVDTGEFPAGATGTTNSELNVHAGPLENKFEEAKEESNVKAQAEKRAKRRIRRGGGFRIDFINPGHNAFIARFNQDSKIILINMDSEIMKLQLHNNMNDEESPSFKTFAYTMAIDEYSRALINIMAANHEFAGTSPEEFLQEGITEMGIVKKRVLDRLSEKIES